MSIDNRIESMRGEVQSRVRKWQHICQEDLEIDARILETLRSPERQLEREAAGQSQLKVGFHQYGLAFDFGIFQQGKYLRDDVSGLYTKCGLIGKTLGFRWGGDWQRFKDYGHLEAAEFTLQQLLNGIKGGQVKA